MLLKGQKLMPVRQGMDHSWKRKVEDMTKYPLHHCNFMFLNKRQAHCSFGVLF